MDNFALRRTDAARFLAQTQMGWFGLLELTTCWTCSVGAFRRAFKSAARRTTYRRACGLGRVIPCSDQAEQRHNIIGNRVALVGQESVSGVTAELPPGQSGAPTHARLYHRERRNYAVPHGAGGSQ